MTFVASNIEEHYIHLGEERGERRGEKRGEERGMRIGLLEGELRATVRFFKQGRISEKEFQKLVKELSAKLEKAKAEKA